MQMSIEFFPMLGYTLRRGLYYEKKIENAQKALALAAASDMAALRETYEEHLAEIQEMQLQLEANDPKMATMIESYRRGFLKGIAANAVNFINNK